MCIISITFSAFADAHSLLEPHNVFCNETWIWRHLDKEFEEWRHIR